MPAGGTFKRLHDTIQNTMNFQSGYPHDPYHLYEFDLTDEGISVTNDQMAYDENKAYKSRYKQAPPESEDPYGVIARHLKTTMRKPQTLKIDKYLEKHRELLYIYDYGDDWRMSVTLEKIVEDHYYGYPILLDGAGTAPPEDVGGIPGYEEFLKIYNDESHPDHEHMKAWADEQRSREYDPEHINRRLKGIMYKKTEWNKINDD